MEVLNKREIDRVSGGWADPGAAFCPDAFLARGGALPQYDGSSGLGGGSGSSIGATPRASMPGMHSLPKSFSSKEVVPGGIKITKVFVSPAGGGQGWVFFTTSKIVMKV